METKVGDLITLKVSEYHKIDRNIEPKVLYIDQDLWAKLVHELTDSEHDIYKMYKGMKVLLVKEDGWCEVA